MTPISLRPEQGSRPFFSVLLVNYNGLVHLEECLSSVCSQDFENFEIVFVDNASRDGSVDFVRMRFPSVVVVEAGFNRGFAGGNNLGITRCRGEHIFFLNNDTRLEPGALRNLADAIPAFPAFRVFACLMLKYTSPTLTDNGGEVLYRGGFVNNLSGYPSSLFTAPREVVSACGGAAVYARDLLDEIGGFDEDFFLLYEDVDLSLRARHHGDRVLFLPTARVLHKGSATIGGGLSPTALYFSTRNHFSLLIKNFPALTLVKCLPGFAMTLSIRFVQASLRLHIMAYLRGIRDGILMIPSAVRKRRTIVGISKIDRLEFESLMRPHWLRERLDFRRGGKTFVP